MNIQLAIGTALAVATAIWAGSARSETVYRCGNTYSQLPCPGGSPLDASDPRTPGQKAQADVVARQAALSATRLEQERLALEKSHAAGAGARPAAAGAGHRTAKVKANDQPAAGVTKHKPRTAPDYFTAAAPPADKTTAKARRPSAATAPVSDTQPAAKP